MQKCAKHINAKELKGITEMRPKIGLITGLWCNEEIYSLFESASKLISILEPSSAEITWVVTNCSCNERALPQKVKLIRLDIKKEVNKEPFLIRIFYHLLHQLKIISKIRKLKDVDMFIFAFGGHVLLLPFLFATLFLKKKTILRIEGRNSVILKEKSIEAKHRIVLIIIFALIERLMYFLASRIVLEFERMIELYNLQKYQHKIVIGGLYVDTSLFKKTKSIVERAYDVGYIGRFSKGKGILEFIHALPFILKNNAVRRVILIGEGDLKRTIRETLNNNNIQNKVELIGWVKNKEKIPLYLNNIKLILIPSYREGLPNIMLEAMACGTPVLATPVGGVPDVITDGETGFIMENNSPECIARNVIRALNHPNLEQIAQNARALVEKEFTFEKAVERYSGILGIRKSEV